MADAAATPLVEIQGVIRSYGALRPLRLRALTVRAGDRLALMGLDQAAAEMFVTLITGAALPDDGSVRLFGQDTREIPDGDRWLALLDGLGILSERAVLVEQYSVAQNIAMPFTLELEPIAPFVRPRVDALAADVGLPPEILETPVGRVPPHLRARVRLARAVALDPSLVLAEHPSATLPREEVRAFARDLSLVAQKRNLGLIVISADTAFVRAFAGTTLIVEPATGEVRGQRFWERI